MGKERPGLLGMVSRFARSSVSENREYRKALEAEAETETEGQAMENAERFKEIFREQITREGAPELLAWLESTDFFTAPASTKYHGAYPGGLVDHSLNVYDYLIGNYLLPVCDAETAAVCALLHDVCKADYYEETETGRPARYVVNDRFPFGHGEKSVYLIERHMRLTDEEALAIRWHMGAYDKAARGGGSILSRAMEITPLVLALHTADMLASQAEKRL